MKILLLRHEHGGDILWETHEIDEKWNDQYDWDKFTDTLRAHLNTYGVVKIELIPGGES